MAIEVTVTVGGGIVSFAEQLMPLRVAVTVTEPGSRPVATPVGVTLARAALDEIQLTCELISAVDPSLYFAVAVSWVVAPS